MSYSEMLYVTRWNHVDDDWHLVSTSMRIGSVQEKQFFRVIIPHEGGRKLFFDSPEAYMAYSQVNAEDGITTERSIIMEDAAKTWRLRNTSLNINDSTI